MDFKSILNPETAQKHIIEPSSYRQRLQTTTHSFSIHSKKKIVLSIAMCNKSASVFILGIL